MNERIQAVVLAYEDAAIQAIVDTITWLKHGTPAWKCGVKADEGQALAEVARRVGNETRHLTRVLLAFN